MSDARAAMKEMLTTATLLLHEVQRRLDQLEPGSEPASAPTGKPRRRRQPVKRRSTVETLSRLQTILDSSTAVKTATEVASAAGVPRSTALAHLAEDDESPSGWKLLDV